MPTVRLYQKGETPEDDCLYELEFDVVPTVGDVIDINMENTKTSYEVVGRLFKADFTGNGSQIGSPLIALSVVEKTKQVARMFTRRRDF